MRVRFYPLVVLLIGTNIFTASCEDKGSLTFVIDNTYSMSDDINLVKQSADAITKIVFEEKASQIKNMVLVTFNDPDARTVIKTESRANFKTHINKVGVYGGGDCPEPSMNGILLGLEKSLPGSFIYVFTDASAKDYWKGREITNLCQKKQTQITFVLTGYCTNTRAADFQVYYDIATACSGIAFFVGKNEVDKVLTTIKETISGNKTAITAIKIPAHQYVNIPFVIDDQTEYAIVTASGTDVYLSIRGPRADQTRIMWINNAKVMKLSDPTPGKYIATVRGSTETSVYIVGRTDFLFSHGFSELEPKILKDTTLQPIADAKTHLSIMVTDPKHTVNILSAQILDMNERVLQILPLRQVTNDFYTTSLFVAPSHRFKVAVKGKAARNGKDIRRIAKIPVTPQDPPKVIPESKKPVISIPEGKLTEVEYAKTIKLTCKVSAFPEPTITWKNSRGAVLKSQSSAVELPYEYISYLTISDVTKGDVYTCHAGNDQGTRYKTIELVVKDPFDVKSAIEGQTEVQYGRKGTLKCDIRASVPMHIYWSLENEKIGARRQLTTSDDYEISADGKVLNINKMDLHMVGKYTCKATLENDSSKFVIFSTHVKIGGLLLPKVTGISNLIADKGLNVAIQCNVAGEPKPTITWEYMAQDSSKFVSIRGSDNVLRISSVEEKHAGRYKCIAHNDVGNDEHVTTLTVQFAPTITSKQTTYKGLEGDVALRIPCDTTGVPQPVITWKTGGAAITPNARYSIINGALVIKNPNKADSNSYVCEAKNSLGSTEATFTAKVDQDLDDYGTVKEVNVLKGTTTKLECGSDDPTQSVRWFMEGNDLKINKKTFNLNNVDVTNEGNYTCRVSGMNGGYTLTYAVVVGFAPEFSFEQEETPFDWNGSEYDMLDCQVESKPPSDVVWTYNGKVLSGQQSPVLVSFDDWGHYTCNVSNVHGAVQKSFNVISSNCLIKRKPKNERTMPLMLTQESTWPVLDSTKNYLNIAPGQKVIFSCPSQSVKEAKNGLQKFPTKNEITATCDKQDIFIVDGKPYKVSDLHCASEIKSIVHKNHEKCLTETSELMRVGYDVHGFLETYEVCFDTSKNIPLYSRVLMSKSNRGPGITHSWYKYPGVGDGKPKEGYVCTDATSSCCYNKTQLVNARDFSDGPAQRSTYIDHLNAVPYWRPCDEAKDPWSNIESMIRSQLSSYSQFIAWSGTHKLQENNGQTIPRYLWKVLRFDEEESIAVVYVNDPSPAKEDILCTNICVSDNVPWLRDLDERTYCCELNEFLQAFGLHGTSIGESMDAALGKIKSKKN